MNVLVPLAHSTPHLFRIQRFVKFSNFVLGGLFDGIIDDGEAQFKAMAFLFVAFRPAS